MHEFSKGEVPSMSMEAAIQVCKVIIKITQIGEFNPVEALLAGAEDPKGGTWNFVQHGKKGEVFRFLIYFPQDKCIVIDESKNNELIASVKRDGTPIKLPELEVPKYKDGIDPFGDK
jgi:hypothetical protein